MSLAPSIDVQDKIIDKLKDEYASGELDPDQSAIKKRASELAANEGYQWTPGKHWVYRIRTKDLKVPKRPYG